MNKRQKEIFDIILDELAFAVSERDKKIKKIDLNKYISENGDEDDLEKTDYSVIKQALRDCLRDIFNK